MVFETMCLDQVLFQDVPNIQSHRYKKTGQSPDLPSGYVKIAIENDHL